MYWGHAAFTSPKMTSIMGYMKRNTKLQQRWVTRLQTEAACFIIWMTKFKNREDKNIFQENKVQNKQIFLVLSYSHIKDTSRKATNSPRRKLIELSKKQKVIMKSITQGKDYYLVSMSKIQLVCLSYSW